jgi:hypothetical protein
MTKKIISSFGLFFALSIAACSSSTGPADHAPGGTRQQLIAKGDCTFEECGTPSSFEGEASIECSAPANDTCEWSAANDDNDSVVGYAYCQDSECPPRPTVDCPADTVRFSQQCGNENNAGCAWTTVCVPPRVTTPCPAQNGCDDQPQLAIGIICSDGSVGASICVTDGQKCFWGPNCD